LGLLVQGTINIVQRIEFNLVLVLSIFVTFTTARYALCIWQMVGIWRSATNHAKRTRRRFWAVAAKSISSVVVILILYTEATFTLPAFRSLIDMYKGDAALGPHVIRVLPGGTEVEFFGSITWGSAAELGKVLDDNPNIRVVHLTSQGGRTGEAESIRELIRRRNLDSYTSATCMSACTIAFLGGRERWIGPGARLGFHQGEIPGANKIFRQVANEGFAASYRRSGINEVFINQILEVPPDRLWFPTVSHLEYAGVITGTAAPGQFAPGGFFMNMAMKEAVPYASIHEMEALAKAFIETLESVERADREACRRYFDPGTAHLVDLRHYMSAELQFRTLEATSRIVAARDSADADVIMTAPTAAGVQSIYPLLETALSNRGVDPSSVKSVLTTPSRDLVRDRICWALIEYYKAILEIPVPERELFLKYKLAQ
jgi:hypothetical protein